MVRISLRGATAMGSPCLYRFLGPRMIYTSGIIGDINVNESLEQLQDNKLTVVCEKVCRPASHGYI